MTEADLVTIALAMADERRTGTSAQPRREITDELRAYAQSPAGVERALELIADETSAFRLGEVLRCDIGSLLPVPVVKATYERLIELGADDALTRLCYSDYLLRHGPEWDDYANEIRAEVEPAARAAGLWGSPVLGHHPVFYAGPA